MSVRHLISGLTFAARVEGGQVLVSLQRDSASAIGCRVTRAEIDFIIEDLRTLQASIPDNGFN
jgi:hypothetical protein